MRFVILGIYFVLCNILNVCHMLKNEVPLHKNKKNFTQIIDTSYIYDSKYPRKLNAMQPLIKKNKDGDENAVPLSDFDSLYAAIYDATHFITNTITQNEHLFPKYIDLSLYYALFDTIVEADLSQYNVTPMDLQSCFDTTNIYGTMSIIARIQDIKLTEIYCQFLCRVINGVCKYFTLITDVNTSGDTVKTCILSGRKDSTLVSTVLTAPASSISGPLICPDAIRGMSPPTIPIGNTLSLISPQKRCPSLNRDVDENDIPAYAITSNEIHLTKYGCYELCLKQNSAVANNSGYLSDTLHAGILLVPDANFTCNGWAFLRLPFSSNSFQSLCRLYSTFTPQTYVGNDVSPIPYGRQPTDRQEIRDDTKQVINTYFDPIHHAISFAQTPTCLP